MIDRDKVSGLKYIIMVGAILAFMGLLSSSETFAQWSPFSSGYGYPGSFYGEYGYPGSFYGGYSGYGSWSGLYVYPGWISQRPPYGLDIYNPLYNYSPGPWPGIPNLVNPIYGLVPPWFGPLWASTHYPVGSPLFQSIVSALGRSKYYPWE